MLWLCSCFFRVSVTNPTSDSVVWPSPFIKNHGKSETCICYHCLTRLLFGDHLSDVKGQCFGQRCSVKGSLSYYRGGYSQVSVAVGQKVVPSPAVSSAMCRMWVIFKESRVLDFNTKRQPLSQWAAVLIGGDSRGKAWPTERPSTLSNSKRLRVFYYIFFRLCVEKYRKHLWDVQHPSFQSSLTKFQNPIYQLFCSS